MIATSGSENAAAAAVLPKVPVVADTKGRLRVSKAQRRDILAALDRSHESVPQFARRTGLKYSTLSRWVQQRRPKSSARPPGLRLLEAVVASAPIAAVGTGLMLQLPGGARRGIPAWMFDVEVCAVVRHSPHPIVQVDSLLEILDLLELNRLEICSVRDENQSQSKESCHVAVAAAEPSHTPVRKPRDRPPDPGGEKVWLRRLAARADRSGRQSSPTSGRRSK